MRVSLCGRVTVSGPGGEVVVTRPQVQLCLAVLTLERHRPLGVGELADALWGDRLSPHWQGALRGVLAKLREVLARAGCEADVLRTSRGLVQLALPGDASVDVEDARRWTRAAQDALLRDAPVEAAGLARKADEVLDGRFVPAVDCAWADERQAELAELRARAVRALAAAEMAAGNPAEAIPPLRALLARDPFDDAAQIALIQAMVVDGERLHALAEYESYVRRLRDELGVRPSAELAAVHDAVVGVEVAPRPGAAPRPARTRSPRQARRMPDVFVGRSDEVGRLSRLVRAQAEAPRLRAAVIDGEQGVGKSSLAARLAVEADGADALVLWTRCSAHGSVPYEPVADALATWLDDGAGGADLEGLRPGLAAVLPGGSAARDHGGATSAGTVFRTVAAAFERMTAQPALWVVDDLQWATSDTLALLLHVAQAVAERPLTLALVCRDRTPAVADALGHLARLAPVETVDLRGLDAGAVRQWLAAEDVAPQTGAAMGEVAERVWMRTGGNPLFVWHLLNAARDAGGELDPDVMPEALATLLDRRIDSLSEDAGLVLAAAALAEPPVSFEVLASATDVSDRGLSDAVAELVRARMVADDESGLRFTHGLVQEAVAAGLGKARRAWLHRRIAAALEEQELDAPGAAAEIARHYGAAGSRHADAARHWSLVAAEDALDQTAYAAAERQARAVLGATAISPDDRVRALVALGRARRGHGDHDGAGDALREALELARIHDLPRRFAEAVLHLAGGGGRGVPHHARYHTVGVIEEALSRLDEVHADDDLRIPLLGALATALLLTDRDDDRERSADEALLLARRYGDTTLLARALLDHRLVLRPGELAEREAELREAFELAEAHGLSEAAITALVYRLELALMVGDRARALGARREAAVRLARHPHPYWRWSLDTWQVLEHVLDGDLAAAEEASVAALAPEAHRADALACHGVQLVMIRIHQGRAPEILELLEDAARDNPQIPCYRAVLAFAASAAGVDSVARRELEALVADDLGPVPRDTNRLLALAVLAEAAVALGEPAVAPILRRELEPYAGQQVILNCYGGGGATWGPVSAHLHWLARLEGDEAGEVLWLDRARADAARIGDRPFLQRLGHTGH